MNKTFTCPAPLCGKELYWSCDFDGNEVDPDRYHDDEDAVISEYTCPHCGSDLFVYMTPKAERSSYPYWQEDQGVPTPSENGIPKQAFDTPPQPSLAVSSCYQHLSGILTPPSDNSCPPVPISAPKQEPHLDPAPSAPVPEESASGK